MHAYIIRRILLTIPTLILVTMLVFLLVRFIPGTALDVMISQMTSGAEAFVDVDGLKHELGLDVSVPVQYGRWVGIWPDEDGKTSGMLQGNLGEDLWTGRPISKLLRARIPVSIELAVMANLFQWGLAIPLGVFAATRQDSIIDYSGRLFAVLMLSMPGFWLATMVIVYPAIWWGTMPTIKYIPLVIDPLNNLKQFLLPAFLTGVASSAGLMRLTRTMMLEVMREDYIRTAWAKGLAEQAVLMRHALKNASIPVVTVLGAEVPHLISGMIIMEQIFALPGMGRLFIDALNSRDYPVISAVNTVIAILILISNIIVDISYAWLDPRIRYE